MLGERRGVPSELVMIPPVLARLGFRIDGQQLEAIKLPHHCAVLIEQRKIGEMNVLSTLPEADMTPRFLRQRLKKSHLAHRLDDKGAAIGALSQRNADMKAG